MRVGNKRVPDYQLPQLIDELKMLYQKHRDQLILIDQMAEDTGHKTPGGGTFRKKAASMRTFGLIIGTGKIHVTELGKVIAESPDDKPPIEAYLNAIRKVELWNALYPHYEQSGEKLPLGDVQLELIGLYNLKADEAKTLAPRMHKAFLLNMKLVKNIIPRSATESGRSATTSRKADSQVIPESVAIVPPANSPITSVGFKVDVEGWLLALPKDPISARKIWRVLRKAGDGYVDDMEEKE